MFKRNYTTRPQGIVEVNSGELLVEKGGVMSLGERVKLATIAGYKLSMEKYLQTFDQIPGSEDFVPVPVARRPGYDLVDAHNDWKAVREKAKQAQQKVFDENKARIEAEQNQKFEEEVAKRIAAKTVTKESSNV